MSIKDLTQSKTYKPEGEPVTPYLLARQEWDNRIGNARAQAANWRLCALGLLVLCIILAIGLIGVASQNRAIPYIVRVGQDGAVQAAGPAETDYTPQEPEIKYFLSQFVQKVRSLPLDPVVAKQNWLSAYNFLSQAGAVKMNRLVREDNPFAAIGSESKQVDISVVVPLSPRSYQVRWKESRFNSNGGLIDTCRMTGLFTLEFAKPKTEEQVLKNPLGLYIHDFSWSKEIDTQEGLK